MMEFVLHATPASYHNMGEVALYAQALEPDAPEKTKAEMKKLWKTWVTEGNMQFSVNTSGNRWAQFNIPEGFMTDFASIPRIFRWYLDPVGAPHQVAAVAHDYLYATSKELSKLGADMVLRDAALAAGTPKFKAAVLYYAVRIGGRSAWKSNRANLLKKGPKWRFIDA